MAKVMLEEVRVIAEGEDQISRGEFNALRSIPLKDLMCHKIGVERIFTKDVSWRLGSQEQENTIYISTVQGPF